MNRKITLLLVLLAATATSQAQLAKKYPMFEHFTQASCGPCAAQNPAFQNNILAKNQGNIHHVAFHTSWPGVDPMYNHNKADVDGRVKFYNITGVPTMMMSGINQGSPQAITQKMVDDEISLGSPVKIDVIQTITDSIRVNVTVSAVNNVATDSYKLLAAMAEKNVTYATPPGTNGEKRFPNVLRKMLTDFKGDAMTIPAKGSQATFKYTLANDSVWKKDSLYTIVYIQNSTNQILNSGANGDPVSQITNGFVVLNDKSAKQSATGQTGSFALALQNNGNQQENFQITFTKDIPSNWNASVTVNGKTFTDKDSVMIAAGAAVVATINVTPGATPYVGELKLGLLSIDNPLTATISKTVHLISGVTDLVVSNNNASGDGKKASAREWESVYMNGLNFIGNTKHAATDNVILMELVDNAALTGVKSIYYNVGWTFPGLTDELVIRLAAHLDNGGNLFISGQDVAWETFDPSSPYTTQAKKDFMTKYMNVGNLVADGTSAIKKVYASNADVFNGVPIDRTTIIDFYGGNAIYPDEVTMTSGGAKGAFYYDVANTKIAGVNNENPTTHAKTVYLGFGLEMLASDSIKNFIVSRTHDYFNGLVTGVKEINSSNIVFIYPNPTIDGHFTLQLNDNKFNKVSVLNLFGQEVYSKIPTANTIQIDLSQKPAGVYLLKLSGSDGVVTKKITIAQ